MKTPQISTTGLYAAPRAVPVLAIIANAIVTAVGKGNVGIHIGIMSNDMAAIHGVMTKALTTATEDVAVTVDLDAATRETGTTVPAVANAVTTTNVVTITTTTDALVVALTTTNPDQPGLAAEMPPAADPIPGTEETTITVLADATTLQITGDKPFTINRFRRI
jgi:hypothetical protein